MRTKIGLSGLVVMGLVIGSLVASGIVRADDAPVKKHRHHHHHGIHGKITAINGSTITVDVHQHHKKGEPKVAAESKTFTLSDKTKIELVSEDGAKSPGSAAALTVGAHVSINEHEGVVEEISIGGHRHHKKKPAA
jgi:hypothetical protein